MRTGTKAEYRSREKPQTKDYTERSKQIRAQFSGDYNEQRELGARGNE
ncbi:hypothetical protein GCM10009792_22260 [Microcella alkalica]